MPEMLGERGALPWWSPPPTQRLTRAAAALRSTPDARLWGSAGPPRAGRSLFLHKHHLSQGGRRRSWCQRGLRRRGLPRRERPPSLSDWQPRISAPPGADTAGGGGGGGDANDQGRSSRGEGDTVWRAMESGGLGEASHEEEGGGEERCSHRDDPQPPAGCPGWGGGRKDQPRPASPGKGGAGPQLQAPPPARRAPSGTSSLPGSRPGGSSGRLPERGVALPAELSPAPAPPALLTPGSSSSRRTCSARSAGPD